MIGKPTHFRPDNRNVAACGVISPVYAGYDARDCDCLLCMKTDKFKIYMGNKTSTNLDQPLNRGWLHQITKEE